MLLAYLDNNATTQPAPEVVAAMLPYLTEFYGNPSSVHRFGQRARQAIDEARAQIAALINCPDTQLLFTGGGTESINTALRGLLATRSPRKKIITTTVEHSATRELCAQLAKEGAQIVEIPVDISGALDLDRLSTELTEDTALVSTLGANNETGVLFPVHEIAQLCKQKKIPYHCDATQAIGKLPVDVTALGFDAMSFASHKFHGPKGVASLFLRRGLRIKPLIIGGPQERARRGGTENVPGIVGMGKAAQLAQLWLNSDDHPPKPTELVPWITPKKLAAMRDRLEQSILTTMDQTQINGDPNNRLPNTTNIGFERLEAEAILLLLSEQGICASAGAACSSGSLEPSHVLQAMKINPKYAHGAIRFSLSRYTTDEEINAALSALPKVIARLRAVLPVG
ncbi:MAG: Aromatic amino acid beta-eliminating lyase/threonine aldolase [Phycisphaerales bacterium]|nr:Aromatic amino acid beta-eliminating lyase/threonine aldolase [Phycisphaerales bacterium]